MAMSWGPIQPHTCRHDDLSPGAEGAVTRGSVPGSALGAPSHPVDYNATDGRHNRESGLGPWGSVDGNSGIASHEDWSRTGHFPDGPGAWRQT